MAKRPLGDSQAERATARRTNQGNVEETAEAKEASDKENSLPKGFPDVQHFNKGQVQEWVKSTLIEGQLDEAAATSIATTFEKQMVTGPSLLELNHEKLTAQDRPYKLLDGPAEILMAAITRVKSASAAPTLVQAVPPSVLQHLQQMNRKLDVFMECQRKLTAVRPVTESLAATQTRGSDWHNKAKKYYGFGQCMVLSQLLTESHCIPEWFRDDAQFQQERGRFPAVVDHIIPKGQEFVGRYWDVNVHEPYNGLLLLRHLERTYQAGKWTMLPVAEGKDAGMFEIYVGEDQKAETVMYYPSFGEARHRVKVSGSTDSHPLTFGMLHGKKVELIGRYKANPSLRALFLKAEMAHNVDDSFPHPETRMQAYAAKCQKILQPNWKIWQASVADPDEPVIEEVRHSGD